MGLWEVNPRGELTFAPIWFESWHGEKEAAGEWTQDAYCDCEAGAVTFPVVVVDGGWQVGRGATIATGSRFSNGASPVQVPWVIIST